MTSREIHDEHDAEREHVDPVDATDARDELHEIVSASGAVDPTRLELSIDAWARRHFYTPDQATEHYWRGHRRGLREAAALWGAES